MLWNQLPDNHQASSAIVGLASIRHKDINFNTIARPYTRNPCVYLITQSVCQANATKGNFEPYPDNAAIVWPSYT